MSRKKSRLVMVVYFLDGKQGRFYSRDERTSGEDRQKSALAKLLGKLHGDYKDKYTTALIYENGDGGALLHKFVKGTQII